MVVLYTVLTRKRVGPASAVTGGVIVPVKVPLVTKVVPELAQISVELKIPSWFQSAQIFTPVS
ncbi:hypothetical protein D9M69_636320 [compost metagenome]